MESSNAHIVCLSETWLKNEFPASLVHIPGYSLYRYDRKWSNVRGHTKRGGGLATYIKTDITHSGEELGDLNNSCKDIELQCLSINLPQTRKIVFVNVYRPPQGGSGKGKGQE